jgi:hypothetical protein
MTVIAQVITVPANGNAVVVFASEPANSNSLSIRNTGTNTVLLGPAGSIVFPLKAGEFLGNAVGPDDTLEAIVQTNGTAGQITILGMN